MYLVSRMVYRPVGGHVVCCCSQIELPSLVCNTERPTVKTPSHNMIAKDVMAEDTFFNVFGIYSSSREVKAAAEVMQENIASIHVSCWLQEPSNN